MKTYTINTYSAGTLIETDTDCEIDQSYIHGKIDDGIDVPQRVEVLDEAGTVVYTAIFEPKDTPNMTTRNYAETAEDLGAIWVERETKVMNLQAAADEIGLSRDEWLYRQGLVDQAKARSEEAWVQFDAAMKVADPSWN